VSPLASSPDPTGGETVSGTGLTDGLPDYNFAVALANSYWYSRYNLGSLAMMSGLGVTFAPPMDAVMQMVAMVDQGSEDGEHVVLPENPALLQAVYAGGDPRFVNEFNGSPNDFTNWRWDGASTNRQITPTAMAQTIIKEVEWAKFFNRATWAGEVTDDFGAMDRFKGLVLFTEAKMQSQFALDHMRNDGGLFVASIEFNDGAAVVTDDTINARYQYEMLQALSDVRMVLQEPGAYNDVYGDADSLKTIAQAADDLFTLVAGLEPSGADELAAGAQAVAWFAATTEDSELQAQALALLADLGDQLIDAEAAGPIDGARLARGLFEASRILNDERYLNAGLSQLEDLMDAYNLETGSFEGVSSLSVWEVGDVLGALNSALNNGGGSLDGTRVSNIYANFFEAVLSRSGLLQSAIPKEMEASPFELERVPDDLSFAYPTIPTPSEAGGPHGTAAVDASEVTFNSDDGTWTVSDRMYDTSGAMHASNEMFWVFSGSAFPEVVVLSPGQPG
jgi:hypothetical protein